MIRNQIPTMAEMIDLEHRKESRCIVCGDEVGYYNLAWVFNADGQWEGPYCSAHTGKLEQRQAEILNEEKEEKEAK